MGGRVSECRGVWVHRGWRGLHGLARGGDIHAGWQRMRWVLRKPRFTLV